MIMNRHASSSSSSGPFAFEEHDEETIALARQTSAGDVKQNQIADSQLDEILMAKEEDPGRVVESDWNLITRRYVQLLLLATALGGLLTWISILKHPQQQQIAVEEELSITSNSSWTSSLESLLLAGVYHDPQTIAEDEIDVQSAAGGNKVEFERAWDHGGGINNAEVSGGETDAITSFSFWEGQESLTDNETLYWYRTKENVLQFAKECDELSNKYTPGTYLYELKRADCGLGYTLPTANATLKPWRVGLLSGWDQPLLKLLAGCEVGHTCPLSPTCEIVPLSHPEQSHGMDVILTPVFRFQAIRSMPHRPNQTRVLYWREAPWGIGHSVHEISQLYQLQMGIHHFSDINNPSFMMPPSVLLAGVFQDTPKSEFAASVISDCRTLSHRQTYINHLSTLLGAHRVHQYGRCGNRVFPSRPIFRGFQVLSKYKFFLSFENTIQTGYSTEKLFMSLLLPSILVYYGDPHSPNVTTTPSYIKVSDFSGPRSLSQYLLHLDADPAEYDKYHEWRRNPESIQLDYLRKVQHLPGPKELMAHELKAPHKLLTARRAMCCRLCNEQYLKERMADRKLHHEGLEKLRTYTSGEIAQRFYGGKARWQHP